MFWFLPDLGHFLCKQNVSVFRLFIELTHFITETACGQIQKEKVGDGLTQSVVFFCIKSGIINNVSRLSKKLFGFNNRFC